MSYRTNTIEGRKVFRDPKFSPFEENYSKNSNILGQIRQSKLVRNLSFKSANLTTSSNNRRVTSNLKYTKTYKLNDSPVLEYRVRSHSADNFLECREIRSSNYRSKSVPATDKCKSFISTKNNSGSNTNKGLMNHTKFCHKRDRKLSAESSNSNNFQDTSSKEPVQRFMSLEEDRNIETWEQRRGAFSSFIPNDKREDGRQDGPTSTPVSVNRSSSGSSAGTSISVPPTPPTMPHHLPSITAVANLGAEMRDIQNQSDSLNNFTSIIVIGDDNNGSLNNSLERSSPAKHDKFSELWLSSNSSTLERPVNSKKKPGVTSFEGYRNMITRINQARNNSAVHQRRSKVEQERLASTERDKYGSTDQSNEAIPEKSAGPEYKTDEKTKHTAVNVESNDRENNRNQNTTKNLLADSCDLSNTGSKIVAKKERQDMHVGVRPKNTNNYEETGISPEANTVQTKDSNFKSRSADSARAPRNFAAEELIKKTNSSKKIEKCEDSDREAYRESEFSYVEQLSCRGMMDSQKINVNRSDDVVIVHKSWQVKHSPPGTKQCTSTSSAIRDENGESSESADYSSGNKFDSIITVKHSGVSNSIDLKSCPVEQNKMSGFTTIYRSPTIVEIRSPVINANVTGGESGCLPNKGLNKSNSVLVPVNKEELFAYVHEAVNSSKSNSECGSKITSRNSSMKSGKHSKTSTIPLANSNFSFRQDKKLNGHDSVGSKPTPFKRTTCDKTSNKKKAKRSKGKVSKTSERLCL